MYRSTNAPSFPRDEPPALQIQILPRNKETDSHLRKYQAYENTLSDYRQAYSVIERSAEKRIACFSSPSYGLQPEHYRDASTGKKRTMEGGDVRLAYDSERISPRTQYEERQEARKQLPIFKEHIEETEMLQAQYVFELQRQCVHHHYAVFRPMDMDVENQKLSPDMTDALCLHCFNQIPHTEAERYMGGSNPIVYVYQSIVDFQAKIWKSGAGFAGNNNTLQPLF